MDFGVVIFIKLRNKKNSINVFELNFYQDQNKWKHKIFPLEVSKIDSKRVVDLLIYKNNYARIKKLNVFSGDRHKNFSGRRCLNSYTSENILMLHKPKRGEDDICSIRTSNESDLYWKKKFRKIH